MLWSSLKFLEGSTEKYHGSADGCANGNLKSKITENKIRKYNAPGDAHFTLCNSQYQQTPPEIINKVTKELYKLFIIDYSRNSVENSRVSFGVILSEISRNLKKKLLWQNSKRIFIKLFFFFFKNYSLCFRFFLYEKFEKYKKNLNLLCCVFHILFTFLKYKYRHPIDYII